ncbi:MAG: type II secretion system F family protein [Actinomycetota bacterium]
MASFSLLVSLGLLFSAIVLGVLALVMPAFEKRQVKQSLQALSMYEKGLVTQRDVSATRFYERAPLLLLKLSRLGRRLSPHRAIDYLNKQLVYAGMPRELDKLLAIKILSLAGGALVVGLLWAVLRPSFLWLILIIVIFAGGGFFLPEFWLSWKGKARQKAIRLALPGVLDLLAVSVEAGLGFDSALSKTIKKMSGPLSEEFARMLKEMQMGTSRKDAFKNLSTRTAVSELKSFLSAMIQADVFGISIADTLKVQAQEMRVRRAQKAEEIAQKAPVKLVFPTILCIFPAIFVVILGPAAIRIYNSLFRTVFR